MYRANKEIITSDNRFNADIIAFEEADISYFRKYYKTWVELNSLSRDIGCRIITIPASFMEALIAYYMNYWLVEGAYAYFDCYSPTMVEGKNRIIVKGGISQNEFFLFRHRDEWDILNYVAFYNEAIDECVFDLYSISKERMINESERFARNIYNKNGLGFRFNIFRELIQHGIFDERRTFSLFDDV